SEQLERGITFTLMHPLEVEVAERIVALCPGVEAVRFGKSGSDAVSAAVRAARGVPDETRHLTSTFAFNDLASLEAGLAANPVAAVVLEPSGLDLPDDGFLA